MNSVSILICIRKSDKMNTFEQYREFNIETNICKEVQKHDNFHFKADNSRSTREPTYGKI